MNKVIGVGLLVLGIAAGWAVSADSDKKEKKVDTRVF